MADSINFAIYILCFVLWFWVSSNVSLTKIHQSTISSEERNRLQFILGIVISCVGMAILFAPERPQQFASICEKYNTVNACQVW